MNDGTNPTQSKKPVAIALIPSVILAVIAAVGWYLYLGLQQDHEALNDEMLVRIDNFEARVATLELERDALQSNLDDERQTRAQIQDSLASQRESLAELKSTLAAEQASAAELEANLERAREERRQLENDLQQEVERLATNSADLEANLERAREERRQLESDLQQEVERLAANSAELEANLERAREERRQLESDLQQEVERLAANSAELEQALTNRQAQQQSLQAQIDAATAEKEQLAGELDEAQARREELQDQIASVNAEVAAKEAALAAARDDITALNGQLAQTREEKHVLEARLVDLSEQQKKEAAHFALLQSRLEQELDEHRVEITQLKNRMTVINLTSEVLFDSGSIEIKPAGRKVLNLIAESLNAYPEREISIDGHTDNVPVGRASRYVSNWDLSTTRAIAALDHLQRAGVAPRRLRAVGHGEHKPIASNTDEIGRQLNRRIEIRLLPKLDETS